MSAPRRGGDDYRPDGTANRPKDRSPDSRRDTLSIGLTATKGSTSSGNSSAATSQNRPKGTSTQRSTGLPPPRFPGQPTSANPSQFISSMGSGRPQRRGQRGSSGDGARKKGKKGKENIARVMEGNQDVTPLPLTGKSAAAVAAILPVPVPPAAEPSESSGSLVRQGLSSGSQGPDDMAPGGFGFDPVATQSLLDRDRKELQEEDIPQTKEWTAKELQERITIKVEETETMTLFVLPSLKVWGEGDPKEVSRVTRANTRYQYLLDRHKGEKDKFANRSAQTFNDSLRNKYAQCAPPTVRDAGVMTYTWDIYDTMAEGAREEEQQAEDAYLRELDQETKADLNTVGVQTAGDRSPRPTGVAASTSSVGISVGSSQISGDVSFRGGSSDQPAGLLSPVASANPTPFDSLAQLPALRQALSVVESAVLQNELQEKQLLYRNHPDADPLSFLAPSEQEEEDEMEQKDHQKQQPALIPLWTFACDLTAGKDVNAMSWNKHNEDLLAVGYGAFEFSTAKQNSGGLILFWSLKNPKYPQKIIRTKHCVTALDFSTEHPHLLAAGFYDGSVAVFDVRENTGRPALESSHATGKHSEAVWSVKWVTKELNKRTQQLCSICTDGTVKQWSIKKGLVPHDLMQLKRVPNKAHLKASMEGISREASGLCFDFPINDGTQYYAGTEDGLIHKCSVSYNEQTLETFYGHTGPVYKVRCSPFQPDTFLSCSADWTCILWKQTKTSPLLRFHSGDDAVVDVDWSPTNSCVFGSVSREGRVEIWDLTLSALDPCIKIKVDKKLTSILFCPNSPVVLVGAKDGSIDVYRIYGVDTDEFPLSHEEQVSRLMDAMFELNEHKHMMDAGATTKVGTIGTVAEEVDND